MKLRDLITRVIKPEGKFESSCSFSDICKQLEVDFHYLNDDTVWDEHVREYWIAPWYCTDTFVGLSVIYFDDEPAAVVFQSARKCDREYHWVSAEMFTKLRSFAISLIPDPVTSIVIADLDREYDDVGYSIQFGEQCLASEVIYQGKLFKVDRTWNQYPDWVQWDDADWDKIALLSEEGSRIIISPSEVRIPYRIDNGHYQQTLKEML